MTFSQIPHSLMCKRLYYPHLISTQLLLSLPVEIHISLIRRNPSPLSNKIRRLSQAAGDRRISENRYSKAPKFSRWRCSRRQRDEFFSLMCHNVSLERSSGDDEFEIIYLRRQEQSHYTFQNVGSSSKFSTTMFPIWVFFVCSKLFFIFFFLLSKK